MIRVLSFLFPPSFQAFLARRIVDAIAAVIFGCGAFLTLALLSYHKLDPSFNVAGGAGPIRNWMGTPGAYAADILMQPIGFAGILLGLGFAAWGARIYRRHELSKFWLRTACLMLATVFAAVALARVPSGEILVQPYMGGSGGAQLLNTIAGAVPDMLYGWKHTAVATLFGVFAIASFAYACGVTRYEWGRVRNWVYIGILLSASAVLGAIRSVIRWVRYYNGNYEDLIEQSVTKPKKKPKARKLTKTGIKASDNIEIQAPKTRRNKSKAQADLGFAHNSEWILPPVDLLQAPKETHDYILDKDALKHNAMLLQTVLQDFNVQGEIVSVHPGPVVTLYELEPAPGVKSSRVISLADDIARSMSAVSVRAAVVPGRNVIGIELPNKSRQTVFLREILESDISAKTASKLGLFLGKDIGGETIVADLTRMPHLLVAGTTGAGKSVAINTMILSLLYRLPPEKCRFLMIDPKMLELSVYDDIPHLLSPVVTDPGKAVVALRWVVQEMENRYAAMSKLGVRNIEGYNTRMNEARKKGEILMRKVQTGFDMDTGKPTYEEQPFDMQELPYIVVVVDEFADLMLVAGKEVENAIQRLAQMARAAGIHLIMATQRPSVDVITGVIKANFPTRISFQVTSKIDSRTILGEGGAEQLLGMGDMLYMAPGGRITRVHGPFVSDREVEEVVNHLKAQGIPNYLEDITEGSGDGFGSFDGPGGSGEKVDELYDEAVAVVAREGKASTSFIQRHLQIGYNRAARIIEEMEKQGVVGPANHVGKRQVLVGDYSEAS